MPSDDGAGAGVAVDDGPAGTGGGAWWWWCPHFKPFAVTAGAARATIRSTRGRNTKNPLDNIDAIVAWSFLQSTRT
jgi:hypothetical protein